MLIYYRLLLINNTVKTETYIPLSQNAQQIDLRFLFHSPSLGLVPFHTLNDESDHDIKNVFNNDVFRNISTEYTSSFLFVEPYLEILTDSRQVLHSNIASN